MNETLRRMSHSNPIRLAAAICLVMWPFAANAFEVAAAEDSKFVYDNLISITLHTGGGISEEWGTPCLTRGAIIRRTPYLPLEENGSVLVVISVISECGRKIAELAEETELPEHLVRHDER